MTTDAHPGDAHPGGDAVLVDARGLRCPLPVIRLAQRAKDAPDGTQIVVWATDPAAAADVPAWCRMRGQRFLGATDEGGHTAYLVQVVG